MISVKQRVTSAPGTERTNQLRLRSTLNEKRTAGLPVVYTLTGDVDTMPAPLNIMRMTTPVHRSCHLITPGC